MEEKRLNVRLSLKYDTHENWMANDPVLLKGEAALVEVSVAQEGKVNSVPSVLMKVGADGQKKYSELPFISALSADTYEWARAKDKPVYTASEIDGLSTFISGEIQDTDHEYKIVKVTDFQYKLMGKSKGDTDYTIECGVIEIPDDSAAIKANSDAIDALEGLVGTTAVAAQITAALASYSTTEQMNAAIATAKGEAVKHADDLNTAMDTRVGVLEGKFGEGEGTVGDMIADAVAVETQAREQAVSGVQGSVDQLAQTHATDKAALEGSISTAQKAADDAQADVDALAGKVGEVPENQTVMGIITNIQENAYDDTELRGLIGGNTAAINGVTSDYLKSADKEELQGKVDKVAQDLQGEIDRATGVEGGLETRLKAVEDDYLKAADKTALQEQITINAGAIELLTNGVDTEKVDGVNDLIKYVEDHGTEVTGMMEDIEANEKAIADEIDRATEAEAQVLTDAKAYTDQEVGASKTVMGEDAQAKADAAQAAAIAKANELNGAMDTRMQAVEGKAHEHSNKDVLDGITAQNITDWNDAVAKEHEHTNKSVLDGITEERVTAWDGAEQAAKDYADGLDEVMGGRMTTAEGKITALEGRAGNIETEVAKKANDADLAAIAKTGSTDDLVQGTLTLVLDCGTSAV